MIDSVSNFIKEDDRAVLFLADIGVYAFREILKNYPKRAKNIGIFEDGMISVMAGMALSGLIPNIYGITPFIVERGIEQIKLDFIYQGLQGNIMTTGASYDFSTLGYSHFCPEDVQILKSLPEIEIIAPGNGKEFKTIFDRIKSNGRLSYFRLSDYPTETVVDVDFGKASVIKRGKKCTVVVFSELLDLVVDAVGDLDVNILYYTTISPFDAETLREVDENGVVFLLEPFLEGTMYKDVIASLSNRRIFVDSLGIERRVLREYGTKREKDELYGFTKENIRARVEKHIRLSEELL